MNKTPNPQDQCCENTLADMRRDALRQYDEMATKANHWSSFIAQAIASYVPKRRSTYDAINSERDFQDAAVKDPNNKVMIDLQMGSTLSAIQLNLNKAISEWYSDSEPYTRTMNLLRKISALCAQAGEKWGMPLRVPVSESIDNSLTIENDCVKQFVPSACCLAPQTKVELLSEQKAYNEVIDALIQSKVNALKELLGNKSKDFLVTFFHEDGEFDFDFVLDDTTAARVKAIGDVIRSINSLRIK